MTPHARARMPAELFGGWEVAILIFMGLVYMAGVLINPAFFGSTDALSALLRDTARVGVMAVGMTFVIVNKELDLSVGSILGLVATVFSILYAPSHVNASIGIAVAGALVTGFSLA